MAGKKGAEGPGWPDSHFQIIKNAFDSGDFSRAGDVALESAVIGSRRYQAFGDIKDQYLRAMCYGIAALAALRSGSRSDLLDMYFMTRLVLDEIGAIEDLQMPYVATYKEMTKDMDRMGKKVAELGIDPDQNPRIFMHTRMKMDVMSKARVTKADTPWRQFLLFLGDLFRRRE